MHSLSILVLTSFMVILTSVSIGCAKHNSAIYCGACIAIVDEMNWQIGQVDAKSTLQVGSFRVDSKGNQGLREIPLARSELHLTELLDDICRHMSDYGESSTADRHTSYVRTSSRDGSAVSISNIRISISVHRQLKSACEMLVEEHEDALLEAFRTDHELIEQFLCVDTMDVCKSHNITEHRQAVAAMRSAAISEQPADDGQMHTSNEEDDSDDSDSESDEDGTQLRQDL